MKVKSAADLFLTFSTMANYMEFLSIYAMNQDKSNLSFIVNFVINSCENIWCQFD